MRIDLLITNKFEQTNKQTIKQTNKFGPKKLKFGLNIKINKSVMCANFGIQGHVVVNKDKKKKRKNTKKTGKNGTFVVDKLLIRC